mmetsp:Transcript_7270/g.18268  ORF Transcript_7270/g.18268 Transcript_7270/m.18268 type:complete len:570 (+) Transcript_7270:63-1772(+)
MTTDIESTNPTKIQEEGGEASSETPAVATQEESSTSDRNDIFSVLPALRRSESFIRRRVEKRQGQEILVKRKKREATSSSDENKRVSNPVDLDELEEAEEAIRRHRSHGSYGILTSSRPDDGTTRSYRRDQLIAEINSANKRGKAGHLEVLNTLRDARIIVYIIDAKVCVTLKEVVDGISRVVKHVRLDPEHRYHPRNQKCILYRDFEGRLFNLVLTSEYCNMHGRWSGNLEAFSVVQAAALFTFLTRSLSCAFELDSTDNFRQVSLMVILGIIFTEEVSLSWTNVALSVRGYPSISAYALNSNLVGTDWLRKVTLLTFVVASASTDETFQKVCTLGGILLTCSVLLANLGSLSWKYLHWKPFRGLYFLFGTAGSPFDPILSFLIAVLTGLCFPFMGHSTIEAGGTSAIESVMGIAVIVAALFILSDYDAFQRFLVLGSEACNQDYVNFCVGAWWALSLTASLTLLYCREFRKSQDYDPLKRDYQFPDDEEPLLEEECSSPIGYKVPHLPLFPVNPSYRQKGFSSKFSCSYQFRMEYALSLLFAVGIGGFICYLGVTKLDDQYFLSDAN